MLLLCSPLAEADQRLNEGIEYIGKQEETEGRTTLRLNSYE